MFLQKIYLKIKAQRTKEKIDFGNSKLKDFILKIIVG